VDSTTRTGRSPTDLDDADQLAPELIGVKGWYLARLRANCFQTPPGFIVPTSVYEQSIDANRVAPRLGRIWSTARHADRSEIQALSRTARHLIAEARIDADTVSQIDDFVQQLGEDAAVAVRSSAAPTAVSGPECAGVHATYTGVVGTASVIGRIHSCWASLFGERALTMRSTGLGDDHPSMAVVVQQLVPAAKSGIVVPIGPAGEVLIEATFGLGEPIVSGSVEPDRYVADRAEPANYSVTIGRKQIILPGDRGQGHTFATPELALQRVLDDDEVRQIARLSARVDRHFGDHHEVEWALVGTTLSVLQIRPVTFAHDVPEASLDRMVCGLGIGLGTSTGRVRIVHHDDDLKRIGDGDVFVATSTQPHWRPVMSQAGAIVTDDGDEHCHAARVARELGIPAVVGTTTATAILAEGALVTVDGARGWILPSQTV
jgi:pyruvate, water dikinase